MKLSDEQLRNVRLKLVDRFKDTDFMELLYQDGLKENQKYYHHPDYGVHSCIIREVFPYVVSIILNKSIEEVESSITNSKTFVREALEEDYPRLFNFIHNYVEIKEIETRGIGDYELPEAHEKYAT